MLYLFIIYFSLAITILSLVQLIRSNRNWKFDYLNKKIKSLSGSSSTQIHSGLLIKSTFISGCAAVFFTMLDMRWFVIAAAFVVIFAVIYGVLYKKRRVAELAAFDKSLVDALPVISSSLRSGATLPEALDHSCDAISEVYADQVRLALNKFNLGVSLDLCLEMIEKNMPTRASSMVINSLIISWQSGGNLPEVLDQITTTIHERFRVEGKLKALTAQGRTQANILCVAPFAIYILMYLVDPIRMQLLFTTWIGQMVLLLAVGLVVLGYTVTQKMLKLEV